MVTSIKLHYIWFKDYYGFHNQGFSFSSKYKFTYDPDVGKYGKITLEKKDVDYIENFFGNNIDVTAVVGQNGTGKTTLLRFIQQLRNGDIIDTKCVIVCEKGSKFWAGIYYKEGYQITCEPIQIEGCNNNIVREIKQHKKQRFLFSNDIRFIYLTEMFNMSQYTASIAGGDDLSFASVLYVQTEDGEEEKHINNPVVRYIHRITDWQVAFLSNGREYVEQFKINFPSHLFINLSYDKDAFANLYVRIKSGDKEAFADSNVITGSDNKETLTSSQNRKLNEEAQKYLNRFLNIDTSKAISLTDEYAKAIFMNIISSLQLVINMAKDEWKILYNMIERIYKSSKSKNAWDTVYELLQAIKENNLSTNRIKDTEDNQINNIEEKVYTDYISVDADRYIEFMNYLHDFLSDKSKFQINPSQPFTLIIPTNSMENIHTFFNNYKKCVRIVDFATFSWGLSSGENLLLNQFGKLMHILKADWNRKYYLPEDANSTRPAKNAVILLDEVEVAFHPEWQRIYFDAFLKFVKNNISEQGTHIQIILATHSPIILSDIPKQNTIFLKKDEESKKTLVVDNKETFAANIFSLYQNAFFLDETGIGAFAEKKLCELIEEIHKLYGEGNKPIIPSKSEKPGILHLDEEDKPLISSIYQKPITLDDKENNTVENKKERMLRKINCIGDPYTMPTT